MNVMSPSKDALGPPYSFDYWFYYNLMVFGEVRAEKQKWYVTKCHLVNKNNHFEKNQNNTFLD